MQPEKFDGMKKHGSDFCSTALVRIRPGEFFARVMAQQVRSSYLLLKHSVLRELHCFYFMLLFWRASYHTVLSLCEPVVES
jgi:hypothetical protein